MMQADDARRHELHAKLEEAVGPKAAATLMALLPPAGWADLATKHDLARLEERIGLRLGALQERYDSRFARLEDGMNLRFEATRALMEARMAALKSDIEATLQRELKLQTRTFFRSSLLANAATLIVLMGLLTATGRLG